MSVRPAEERRRPDWLKVRLPQDEAFRATRGIVAGNRLHTVCESARCPNIGECWGAGTATFMILGDVCTRGCAFCAVTTGRPTELDSAEPERVAKAVATMKVRHAVITSVTRDDLTDGGASIFAATTRAVRCRCPGVQVELLIPDFGGSRAAVDIVLDERPDILNHNVETIPRLYRTIRPQAKYERSLWILARAKSRGLMAKSSLMVGLGETEEEIRAVLKDLRGVDCDIATIGQYLQPTKRHTPVRAWITPEQFERYRRLALDLGFRHCESGPLVRSSYHAERALRREAPEIDATDRIVTNRAASRRPKETA